MSDLTLPLKGEYFDAIKYGRKVEEFRLVTPYWIKRLEGRWYSRIILTRGYPRSDDSDRRLVLPWRGYTRKKITHPHFGDAPVEVFAIDVFGPPAESGLSDRQGSEANTSEGNPTQTEPQ